MATPNSTTPNDYNSVYDEILLQEFRKEWQAVKKSKIALREERFQKKTAYMHKKYAWLRRMEDAAKEEGRVDFNIEELYHMLYQAYFDARPGKRGTYDVQRVEVNLFDNLYELAQDIYYRRYHPSRSEAFVVFDPVIREIFAASFRDRIVHHLLINICMPWWNRQFIRDSYSCRIGKGTDYGVHRAAKHIARVSHNYQDPTYFVKMDIKGFFMSMERKKLLELAVNGAHRQFYNFGPLGRLTAYLWRQIIPDDPLDGVRIRGRIRDWDNLPRDKSLFFQAEGRGIVIGNLTSQLLSNIFLDSLDKFIVYELGYHHYGRYVDDFYVVVPESQLPQVRRDIERIRLYLLSIGLTLHPKKTKWIRVDKGVPYLGRFIKNGHIEMDRRFQANYYQALIELVRGTGDLETVKSYMGGCINYGCRKMQKRIWNAAGQDFNL